MIMGHSYLTRRGQRYYFRMRVPADLFCYLQQRYISASLRTSRYDQAKRRVRVILRDIEQMFTTLRMGMLTDKQIEIIFKNLKDKILGGLYKHRERGSNFLEAACPRHEVEPLLENPTLLRYMFASDEISPPDHVDSVIEYLNDRINVHKTELRSGRFKWRTRSKVYEVINDHDLPVELPPENYINLPAEYYGLPGTSEPTYEDEGWKMQPPADFNRIARTLLRTEIDILGIEIERLQGTDTSYDKQRRQELAKPNKLLSEVLDIILIEQKQATKKTAWSKVEQHHTALLRILGDKPIRNFNEQDILRAGEIVKAWPKKASSTSGLNHLSPEDIIKRTDLGEPLKPNTCKSRLTQLNSIFKRALEKGWIDRSPCPRWRFQPDQQVNDRGELESADNHKPWSTNEIQRLLYTSYLQKPAHRLKTPENFWLPILALFTGCRLNELAQLYCDDILQDDEGYWVIRIVANKSRRQGTKNSNSIRRVPVHRMLINLGLLQYRDWIAKDNERLFPRLPYCTTNENFSNSWSKRFGHHAKRHMTWDDPDQSKVFHGFRATFIQTMRDRNGVHMENINYLTGHAPQHKMADRYAGRKPTDVLDKHLQKLDYGVDFMDRLGHWDSWHK